MIGQSLLGEFIQPACVGVGFDPAVWKVSLVEALPCHGAKVVHRNPGK
jgi:hypothetical protein